MANEFITMPVTTPCEGNRLINSQPLNEASAQSLIEQRLTNAHFKMLIEKCKIDPTTLAQSGLFSLRNDEVARQFLGKNGFVGSSELIGIGLACPDYAVKGNLLGHTVLNNQPIVDETGNPVFYEEARDCLPRIGVGVSTYELAHDILYSGFMVWSSSPIYTLMAQSKGFAAYHVWGGDQTATQAQIALRQQLRDMEPSWIGNDFVCSHLFLHPSPKAAQSVRFDAMRAIAGVLRGHGAEVIEVQLGDWREGGEWLPDSHELTPHYLCIRRVHQLLDLLSAS